MSTKRWLVWLLIGLISGLVGCGLIGSDEPPADPAPTVDTTGNEEDSPRIEATPTPSLPPTFTPSPNTNVSGFSGNVDAASVGNASSSNNGTTTETGSNTGGTAIDVMATHIVARGDTLGLIAQQYGVSVQAIANANNIQNIDRIEVGAALIIPQP